MHRRTFIEFLGKGTIAVSISPLLLNACKRPVAEGSKAKVLFTSIDPSHADDLVLADGFNYEVLVGWKDAIAEQTFFGFNNDYTAFIPTNESMSEGVLWVNHEYINELFVSGYLRGDEKTKAQVEKEQYNIGGSILKIRKKENGQWEVVKNDPINKRINGQTKIPFNWDEPIMGQDHAIGTLANCSGGVTPWGTILTCEENYDGFYGERNHETGEIETDKYYVQWRKFFDYPPEHYGWVVEIDPKTGEAQKHIALGRCAHECATVQELEDGRVVVYTSDDANDECFYKFISSKPGSLKEGKLYVANLEAGKWESLAYEEQPVLQEQFANQTEVLIRLREAAKLVGGTQLDRPEDIDIDPISGHVLVALTNNKPKGNYFGSILKIMEDNDQHDSLTFKHETFLAGGEETGFACPDNMAFDTFGNLWFTSDISGSAIGKPPYEAFKNNGLFVVPRSGEQAGKVLQVASAPNDAELTGPFFAPDGKTLFLSVQHPGEQSESLEALTSNWPDGGDAVPRPSVVAIQGEALKQIQGIL